MGQPRPRTIRSAIADLIARMDPEDFALLIFAAILMGAVIIAGVTS